MIYNGLIVPFELWKDITDIAVPNVCPNYMISNFGNVYDKVNNRYKSLTSVCGYLTAWFRLLDGNSITKRVHRVVKLTFDYVEGCEDLQIDHINGCKTDNYLFNLDWVTGQENVKRAFDIGLRGIGQDSPVAILNDNDIHMMCSLLEKGVPIKEITQFMNDYIYPRTYKDMQSCVYGVLRREVWISISQNYTFFNYSRKVLTDEMVEFICQQLQDGVSYSDILINMGFNLDILTTQEINKLKNRISLIKNGYQFKNISSNYAFP